MLFHHVGIATEDINVLIDKLKVVLDIKEISEIVYDELQDANLCMVTLSDGTRIELISGNMVEKIVKKEIIYIICVLVQRVLKVNSKD